MRLLVLGVLLFGMTTIALAKKKAVDVPEPSQAVTMTLLLGSALIAGRRGKK